MNKKPEFKLSWYNWDTQSYDLISQGHKWTDESIQPYIPMDSFKLGIARSIFRCYRDLHPELSTMEIYLKTLLDIKDAQEKK